MSEAPTSREAQPGGTPALGAPRIRSATMRTAPQLVVALHCDAPLAGSSRQSLAGLDSVMLARGGTRRALRGGRELRLELPDRWVSSVHARLFRRDGRWFAADAGSTNGTMVNGASCAETALRDDDLLEVGRTLLWYRDAAPRPDTTAAYGRPRAGRRRAGQSRRRTLRSPSCRSSSRRRRRTTGRRAGTAARAPTTPSGRAARA